jgi:hypothetical protein
MTWRLKHRRGLAVATVIPSQASSLVHEGLWSLHRRSTKDELMISHTGENTHDSALDLLDLYACTAGGVFSFYETVELLDRKLIERRCSGRRAVCTQFSVS